MMELTTTLRLCRKREACDPQYDLLVDALGPDWGDDAPIPLLRLLDLNAGPGWTALSNAVWALRAVPPEQRAHRDFVARLFSAGCTEMELPVYERKYPRDYRPRYAVEVACQYAHGEADANELAAAREAAEKAAEEAGAAWGGDAARAAWDAARAAWLAANGAAWVALAIRDAAARAAWLAGETAVIDAAQEALLRKLLEG